MNDRTSARDVIVIGGGVIGLSIAWELARHGVTVRVLEQGFSYQGQAFGSLSEVAQHITGTKWNGQVFFGLKARTR